MYATVEQLVALFGERTVRELSNRGDPDAPLETSVLEEAIRVAGSEVDSYLAASRPVPLAEPIPPVVTAVVTDIVRYRLTSGDLDETDAIVLRYNRALAWLHEVAQGAVTLPGANGEVSECGVDINPGRRPWDGVTP